MRKFLTIAGLFLAAGFTASAQATVEAGTIRLNAGGGVSNMDIMAYIGGDFGVADRITVGGEISLRKKDENLYGGKFKNTAVGFMANGNYHFGEHIKGLPSPLDLYGGVSLGYYKWDNKWEGAFGSWRYSGDYDSGFVFLVQAGGRWFFSNNWGANAELYAGSFFGFKIGVTYQF